MGLFWAAASSRSSDTAREEKPKNDMAHAERKWPQSLYTFVKLIESRSPEFNLSASEALKYSASGGSLSAIIKKALASGQNDETAILFRTLVDIVWKRIIHYSRCLAAVHGFDIKTEAPMGDDLPLVLNSADKMYARRELEFFVEVFAMMNDNNVRVFTTLFTTEQYDKMDQIVEALRATIDTIGLNRFIEIPVSLKPLLVIEDETQALSSATVATLADDEKNSSEQLPAGFEESIVTVLADFKDLNFNLGALQSIQAYAPKIAKLEYIDAMIDGMDAMFQMVDIRVREVFFATFQKLFINLPKERRNEAMQRFYAKRGVENLKKFVQSYDADLNHWSNRIGDHNQFQGAAGQTQLDEMCANFAWLFLIAPKPTLWSLLTLCMASEAVVPNVIKVLRNLPEMLALKDPQTEDGIVLPIPLSALRRLLNKSVVDSDESSDKFLYVASAFARDKRVAKKTVTVLGESTEYLTTEQPVIDPSALINDLIKSELLAERHSLMMLKLLGRLLTGKSAPIKWSSDLRQAAVWNGQDDLANNASSNADNSPSVEAPKLLLLLLDIYRKNANVRGGGELSRTSLKTLKALGDRLGLDTIVFSDITTEWIVAQLNEHEWTVKLLVMEWMAKSLGDRAGQKLIPTCLWKALPVDVRSGFAEIDCFNHSPVECFLRSLFELAIVGPDYVIALIDKGFSSIPSREALRPALAQTVVDCSSALPTEQLVQQVYPVLKCLVGKLDPSREYSFLDSTSNATWRGLAAISPLLLFGDATLLSLKNQAISSGPTMLQAYCQLAKEHIDREMNDLRLSRKPTYRSAGSGDKGTPGDDAGDRTVSVGGQLNQVFFQACQLAKTGDEQAKIPQCLQLLLICLTEYNEEVKRLISVSLEVVADTKEEKPVVKVPKEQTSTATVQTQTQTATAVDAVANGLLEHVKEDASDQLSTIANVSTTSSSRESSLTTRSGSDENSRPTTVDNKVGPQAVHTQRTQYKSREYGKYGSDQRSTSVENALFQANNPPPHPNAQYNQPPPGYESSVAYPQQSRGAAGAGQRRPFQQPSPSQPMHLNNADFPPFADGNRSERGRGGHRGNRQQQTWSAAIGVIEPTTRDLLESKTAQYQQQAYSQPPPSRNTWTASSWNGSQNTTHVGSSPASNNNTNNSNSGQQSTWSGPARGARGGGGQRYGGGGSGGGGGWNKRGGGGYGGGRKN